MSDYAASSQNWRPVRCRRRRSLDRVSSLHPISTQLRGGASSFFVPYAANTLTDCSILRYERPRSGNYRWRFNGRPKRCAKIPIMRTPGACLATRSATANGSRHTACGWRKPARSGIRNSVGSTSATCRDYEAGRAARRFAVDIGRRGCRAASRYEERVAGAHRPLFGDDESQFGGGVELAAQARAVAPGLAAVIRWLLHVGERSAAAFCRRAPAAEAGASRSVFFIIATRSSMPMRFARVSRGSPRRSAFISTIIARRISSRMRIWDRAGSSGPHALS